jgi:hypothetical protein
MKQMRPVGSKKDMPYAQMAFALIAAMAAGLLAGGAHAQQGPRYGLAAATSQSVVVVAPLVAHHPVYTPSYPGSSHSNRSNAPLRSAPPTRGPYLVGTGQWVPEGAQKDVFAFQAEPGYTMATPAAASGHWDWKRASLADLVELSRRNKAARAD